MIVPAAARRTDLIVDGDLAFASPVPFGIGPISLTATVRNNGDGDAAAATLRNFQSADATITMSGTQSGTGAERVLSTRWGGGVHLMPSRTAHIVFALGTDH